MTCQNLTVITASSIKCECLGDALLAGPFVRPGKPNPNYPCDRCRSEWTDDTPPDPEDRSTWTPTLLSFMPPDPTLTPNPRGLGDTIALGLEALGIRKRKGCGCGKRQAALNRLFPYKDAQ